MTAGLMTSTPFNVLEITSVVKADTTLFHFAQTAKPLFGRLRRNRLLHNKDINTMLLLQDTHQ